MAHSGSMPGELFATDVPGFVRELAGVCRELGITQVRWGEVTIVLGPTPMPWQAADTVPPPANETPEQQAARKLEIRRALYHRQLGRVPSDEELARLP